jgi:hypothetical protein
MTSFTVVNALLIAARAQPEPSPELIAAIAKCDEQIAEAKELDGIREQAHVKYGSDDIEIDSTPLFSRGGDPGWWVSACVWVADAS